MPAASTRVKFHAFMSEDLFDQYNERAMKYGRTLEAEVELRLQKCRSHNAIQPIFIDDDQRNELAVVLGRTVKTTEELINAVKKNVEINVNGVQITLDEALLTRLKSRCFGLTLEQLIHKQVIELLEGFAGMR